ncbi:peptidoglycan-binding protein [Streptomyces sp. NPDC002588]|uniref:L,D-transpeptidase family protein n=1 Tax=Streptomyces sp. NPDC002588 TaxID=3154419 RepID=UPI003323397B
MYDETKKQHRRHLASAALLAAALVGGALAAAPAGAATPRSAEAASVAAQAASWPTVRSGQRGVDVTTVQLLLTARGYSTGADGVFGPDTVSKVKAFQRAKGLAADGVVGPNTWAKLIVTVRTGSRGNAVKAAQRQLTDNGYALTADGVFGSGTAAKVKAFQRAKGLTVDGVVGTNTWAKLVSGGGSGGGTVTLKFDKNPSDQTNSKLYVLRGSTVVASYRAGSGTREDECVRNKGWLPNGSYSIGMHSKTYNGSLIKGYVIRLADKKCTNGTSRTELFIHSEMTRTGGQGSIERERWTDRNPVDFYSNGCIKLRPNDIKALFKVLDQVGWPKTLKVVS